MYIHLGGAVLSSGSPLGPVSYVIQHRRFVSIMVIYIIKYIANNIYDKKYE